MIYLCCYKMSGCVYLVCFWLFLLCVVFCCFCFLLLFVSLVCFCFSISTRFAFFSFDLVAITSYFPVAFDCIVSQYCIGDQLIISAHKLSTWASIHAEHQTIGMHCSLERKQRKTVTNMYNINGTD